MIEFIFAVALSLQPAAASAPADAAAIKQFHAEIAKYVAIRRGLRDELSGPIVNSSAAQLNNVSDSLAAAIRRRRPDAKPGAIFTPAFAEAVKQRIGVAVRDANLAAALVEIDDEEPIIRQPSIYLRFPDAAQMATMPPSLLAALPELPKELEYRIIGSYLVLRDIDAALVIDYIPAAVPRK